ncbi:3-phosphoshikimate 1-carboxyvinyltransferase [Buchnera aphidicola (Kurisakia onigurumii)]|uniref:3-phosphoshikimate 1-carboxyvinyltransferase n=1 Tax=Buchnera aphidicola TaxID=9 RepID=UPI0031B6A0E5
MEKNLLLNPVNNIYGNILLPGSKSISNRVLLISALSTGITKIENLLDSDDTKYMLHALKILGVKCILTSNNTKCNIIGLAKPFQKKNYLSLFLGNAGTALRPLLSILSLSSNNVLLTGEKRMKERPVGDLVESLRQGGAIIKYNEKKYHPPLLVQGGFKGGMIQIDGSKSSQFLTSLLIATPLAKLNSTIIVKNKMVSKPYIDITLDILKKFGISVTNNKYKEFYINGNQNYQSPGKFVIEGDASSASYFLAAAAIKGGTVTVSGIGSNSIQGDIYFAEVLKQMGAKIKIKKNSISCTRKELYGIDLDLNHIPDAAMTVAILALFAKGKTTIRNIENWKIKESNRIEAMANELRKIGSEVIEGKDFISINPPKHFYSSTINTYNDHRIAMCFSLICLSGKAVTILNPDCVSKTFPEYFKKFSSICH